MSPIILSIVRKNLEPNLKINPKRFDKLMTIISGWGEGDIIYPNHFKSQLLISFSEAYTILDNLVELGILKYVFQIYCHRCNEFQGRTMMDSLNKFPHEAYCDFNHKLSASKDVIVLYEVKIHD